MQKNLKIRKKVLFDGKIWKTKLKTKSNISEIVNNRKFDCIKKNIHCQQKQNQK